MGRRIAALLGGTAALVAWAALASAAPPVVVPPRLDPEPRVPYPSGVRGDSAVLLILVVNKDGSVASVDLEAGDEPFVSAAKKAAAELRFQPATRDGVPTAARIRFAITFVEPKKEDPPPGAVPAPAAPLAGPKALEVVVRAEKPPPSVRTMSRTEVRQLPGAFGDPFRAIEVLPGVTPVVSGLPFFYVRGAPPGNIGYFLDGVRVPYLFHAAAGPSVVNPAIVERVDLYSGGYPARYGRFAGAIVAAETTEPRTDWHGEGNIRIVDAGVLVEGGFAGGRGTVLVGGRYSYTGLLFSLISPTVKLDYRDYQLRVTYDLTPRDRVSLFAFGAYDFLAQTENGVQQTIFGSEFYRFDLRYDRKLGEHGTLRWAATTGFDQTRVGEQRNGQDVPFGTRVVISYPLDDNLTVRGGVDAQFDTYTADERRFADPDDPETKRFDSLFPARTDVALGAWTDLIWKASPRVTLTPGLRFDLFQSAGASAGSVDGRVALRAELTKRVRMLHAVGIADQPPSFLVPLPGVAVATLDKGLQRSVQMSAGVEVDLPGMTTASATIFDDVFLNMSDTIGVRPPGNPATSATRSLGNAYGLELYIRRRMNQHFGGFVSYTLSRSSRRLGQDSFPSGFDRTHVFNLAMALDLTRGWSAGARVTAYSGAPLLGSQNALVPTDRSGAITLPRDPAFYRIDLRFEKRWSLGKTRWISFVAEMLNTTVRKETVNGREVGPVAIPSVGVEGGF